MQGNKKLIVYVRTYWPKNTWSPRRYSPPKGSPSRNFLSYYSYSLRLMFFDHSQTNMVGTL